MANNQFIIYMIWKTVAAFEMRILSEEHEFSRLYLGIRKKNLSWVKLGTSKKVFKIYQFSLNYLGQYPCHGLKKILLLPKYR